MVTCLDVSHRINNLSSFDENNLPRLRAAFLQLWIAVYLTRHNQKYQGNSQGHRQAIEEAGTMDPQRDQGPQQPAACRENQIPNQKPGRSQNRHLLMMVDDEKQRCEQEEAKTSHQTICKAAKVR